MLMTRWKTTFIHQLVEVSIDLHSQHTTMEAKEKGRSFERGFPEAEKLLAEDEWASSQHCTPSQKSQAHGRMFYVSFSLLNITLGLVLGYFCVRYSRLSVTSWGVNPNTPVPQDIFTMRKNVAFR